MKVSIITATFNSEGTLLDTIRSVNKQGYDDIEHIFVDGGSTDGTLGMIGEHACAGHIIISQAGRGIYNALNLGVRAATGDLVGFLHSDDFYSTGDCVQRIVDQFSDGIHGIYGDLSLVAHEDTSKVLRSWKSSEITKYSQTFGWMPPHPTLYLRSEIIKELEFDETFEISGDYDFVLRLLQKDKVVLSYLAFTLVHMRSGGASNGSVKKAISSAREDYRALRKNFAGGWMTVVFKRLRKINQVF